MSLQRSRIEDWSLASVFLFVRFLSNAMHSECYGNGGGGGPPPPPPPTPTPPPPPPPLVRGWVAPVLLRTGLGGMKYRDGPLAIFEWMNLRHATRFCKRSVFAIVVKEGTKSWWSRGILTHYLPCFDSIRRRAPNCAKSSAHPG